MNEFPTYKPIIVDDECGLTVISLVEEPAVETDFVAFDKQKIQQVYFMDEKQHIITGCPLRADFPIYRNNINGTPGYILFTKDIIKSLVLKYSKEQKLNTVSLHHNGQNVEGCTLIESYIIDREHGINPEQFKDIEDGSWIISFKIENQSVWESIESKEVNGFSVEGLFGFDLVKLNSEQTFESYVDELLFSVDTSSLVEACNNQSVVELSYNDGSTNPSTGPRKCIIVAVGMSTANNIVFRAYQLEGVHKNPRPKDWCLMKANCVTSFKVVDTFKSKDIPFDILLDINPFGDTQMKAVYAMSPMQ